MATFLTTTGVSAALEEMIKSARQQLVLISPYLKIAKRLKTLLEDQDRMKIDIRVVYGKNELKPDEINWLNGLQSVRTSFCQNLHAKCYMNEDVALITSMNLYEFSQVNNEEMGILVRRDEDQNLYDDIALNVQQLLRHADEVRVSLEHVGKDGAPSTSSPKVASKAAAKKKPAVKRATTPAKGAAKPKKSSDDGVCIRCAAVVVHDPAVPYCSKCFKSWNRWKNDTYEEKHCHSCGNDHLTTKVKPECPSCYRKSRR